MHLLHSQRTDGGDKAGLVGLPLIERKAPTRTAREISADMLGNLLLKLAIRRHAEQGDLCPGTHCRDVRICLMSGHCAPVYLCSCLYVANAGGDREFGLVIRTGSAPNE